MKANDIIQRLAERQEVERIVLCVTHKKALYFELQDLAQMVYEIMLAYDDAKIVELYEKGLMEYFIAKIVSNQYYSTSSQYDKECRFFSRMSSDYPNEEEGEEEN